MASVLRIGAWRVDPTLYEISRDGQVIQLEPRAMRLLLCLAERAGQVVSVGELLDHVWNDVVVTQDSVYQAVAALRKVLGDDSREPVYIATLPRRGYRLVASVQPWSAASAPSPADPVPPPAAPTPPDTLRDKPAAPSDAAPPRPGIGWRAPLLAGLALVAVGGLLGRAWLAARSTAQEAPVAMGGGSVAVLPFMDLSEKHDQGYFADGLSEELIDLLASVPDLQVPARTSSFYFKDKSADIPEIARRLKVAHVLEGSVRKSGDQLRVTAQLIRADNGYHVWSKTYDRPLTDVFAVQDDIATEVVKAMKLSLNAGFANRAQPTAVADAYTDYLQARSLRIRGKCADFPQVIANLQQAVSLDPKFALAWTLLARVYVDQQSMCDAKPPQLRDDALSAANRARQLDPKLPEAHVELGHVLYVIDFDYAGAAREFDEALALDPNNERALWVATDLALVTGRHDKALELAQRALTRNPLDDSAYNNLAKALRLNGRLGEAVIAQRRAVALNPTFASRHAYLGLYLLENGDPAGALKEFDQETDEDWRRVSRPLALDALGRRQESDREMVEIEQRDAASWAYQIGLIYACRDDREQAFRWLERAYRQHDDGLVDMRVDACVKRLSDDPRYGQLLASLHLPG